MTNATALSETGNERIKPGGNMSPFDEVSTEIDAMYEEAKIWADGEPIANEEQHDAVSAVHKSLHDLGAKADALRVAEKKPLDDQVKAIQKKYQPLIGDTKSGKGKVVLGKSSLNVMLTAWRTEVVRKKADAAEIARREAEEEHKKAEAAIHASAGNLEEREQAEEQLGMAKEADKFAKRQEKSATTGLGFRTTYKPTLTDINAAIRHYWAIPSHREKFVELVTQLASADVSTGKRDFDGKPGIPGFTINPTRKAST